MMKKAMSEIRATKIPSTSRETLSRLILQSPDLLSAATTRSLCKGGPLANGSRPLNEELVMEHSSSWCLIPRYQQLRILKVTKEEFVPHFIQHGQIPRDPDVVKRLNGIPFLEVREKRDELSVQVFRLSPSPTLSINFFT